MKSQDLIDKIRSLKKLTPSETKIAEYFSRNYTEIVFENVTSISEKTGVSKATVVRFISKLGYHKFSAFRNELRHSALLLRTPLPTRFTFKQKQAKKNGVDILERNFSDIMRNLQDTHQLIDQETFMAAVRTLVEPGRNLYITGQRTSYAMAYVFHIMIKRIRPNSFLLGPETSILPDMLMDIQSRDILFTIFRHPYAKQTLRIARRFAEQGAQIILLTDSEFSPLADLSHIQMVVASEGYSIFQSCTPVIAVLETLNLAALKLFDKTIYHRLENAEKLFRDFELFCPGKSYDTSGIEHLKAFRKKNKS
ncbi:MAG: MurR/RpiR family transcriptional regulator [Deltaproteobacteria bacterium]|nr:MurR/RpiR family transcriptional regulator [Deltaproteobacteria bacterium]